MNKWTHDLKLLLCFDALMAERSVSRAAERMNLSQPAMSHALARLRGVFDDPLFLKGSGRMIPTGRALQLEAQVRELLAGLQRLAEQPASFDPPTARVKFTVMAPEYAEYLLAPPLAVELRRAAPHVVLDFHASDPGSALTGLAYGDIDFRLGWWPDPPPALRYKALFRDRLACLVRKGHPRFKLAISIEDYVGAAHVRVQTPRTSVSSGAVDEATAALRRTLHVALRVQNLLVMSDVVAASDLVATVPERLARQLATKYPLQMLPLPLTVPDVRMALYWHERTHKHAAHRWFRQLVSDAARAL